MSRIYTVCGPIRQEELGFTTMHEHVLCDISGILGSVAKLYAQQIPKTMMKLTYENLANLRSGIGAFSPECSMAGDVSFTVREFQAFKMMGGNAVVDASPIGGRGDITEMQEASKQSGIHLVTCTGLYIADAQPDEHRDMSEAALTEYFVKEVLEGIGDTGVRAGFVKCAINTLDEIGKVDAAEIKAVRACAKAAVKTGCSIHIHNAFPLTTEHIIPVAEMVLSLGVRPEKLLMLHMDSFLREPRTNIDYIKEYQVKRGVDIDMQATLLDKGLNIGFDSWDTLTTTLPDNWDRLKALTELLRRGYGGQIVLGHDVTDKTRGVSYGYTGFTGFIRNALPTLKELGFEAEIQQMTVDNPARILGF